MKTEYFVTFSYTYCIEAEDEKGAEDLAWDEFSTGFPRPKDFGVETEEGVAV